MRAAIQAEQQLSHARASRRVEVTRGLVGKQHRWARHERSGNRDALLLTAGELAWIMPGTFLQPDAGQRLRGHAAGVCPAGQFQRQHHVFQGCERGNKVKRLKYEADALSAQACAAIFVESREILALKKHPAAAGGVKPRQEREQCGLAGTGGTRDGDRIAGRDVQ